MHVTPVTKKTLSRDVPQMGDITRCMITSGEVLDRSLAGGASRTLWGGPCIALLRLCIRDFRGWRPALRRGSYGRPPACRGALRDTNNLCAQNIHPLGPAIATDRATDQSPGRDRRWMRFTASMAWLVRCPGPGPGPGRGARRRVLVRLAPLKNAGRFLELAQSVAGLTTSLTRVMPPLEFTVCMSCSIY